MTDRCVWPGRVFARSGRGTFDGHRAMNMMIDGLEVPTVDKLGVARAGA